MTIDGTASSTSWARSPLVRNNPSSPTFCAIVVVSRSTRLLPLHRRVILDQVLAEVSYHVIVVIHHYAKWLSDNETRPHRDIAPSGAPMLLHLPTYH